MDSIERFRERLARLTTQRDEALATVARLEGEAEDWRLYASTQDNKAQENLGAYLRAGSKHDELVAEVARLREALAGRDATIVAALRACLAGAHPNNKSGLSVAADALESGALLTQEAPPMERTPEPFGAEGVEAYNRKMEDGDE